MKRICQQIEVLWSLNQPLSDLQREPEELGRTNLAAVNAAAEKYGTPSRATMLLVGDSAKIESGVRQLGSGDVVLIDVEGHPLKLP